MLNVCWCDTWSCCDARSISDLIIWPLKYYRIVTKDPSSEQKHMSMFCSLDLVFLSSPAVGVEMIPWTASRTVPPAALWPRLCHHGNGQPASPNRSLRCWGRTNAPSTPPADPRGTTSPGPPSRRPLLLVRDPATDKCTRFSVDTALVLWCKIQDSKGSLQYAQLLLGLGEIIDTA